MAPRVFACSIRRGLLCAIDDNNFFVHFLLFESDAQLLLKCNLEHYAAFSACYKKHKALNQAKTVGSRMNS
jgi:hypothetical protein